MKVTLTKQTEEALFRTKKAKITEHDWEAFKELAAKNKFEDPLFLTLSTGLKQTDSYWLRFRNVPTFLPYTDDLSALAGASVKDVGKGLIELGAKGKRFKVRIHYPYFKTTRYSLELGIKVDLTYAFGYG